MSLKRLTSGLSKQKRIQTAYQNFESPKHKSCILFLLYPLTLFGHIYLQGILLIVKLVLDFHLESDSHLHFERYYESLSTSQLLYCIWSFVVDFFYKFFLFYDQYFQSFSYQLTTLFISYVHRITSKHS